jgi:hypothetical protein
VRATERFRPIFTSSLILDPRQEGHAGLCPRVRAGQGFREGRWQPTTRRGGEGALAFAADRQDKNVLLLMC